MAHSNMMEWIYVAVVVALLVYVGAEAWNIERIIDHAPEDAEIIKVTAQQWFWSFEHENGTKEVGEIHLKKDHAYKFEISSKYVIHNFKIPDYVVLLDAVPGRINTVWFSHTEAGVFDIQCREYFGFINYNLRAKLFVDGAL